MKDRTHTGCVQMPKAHTRCGKVWKKKTAIKPMNKRLNHHTIVFAMAFVTIILVAAFFRLYGLNWDQGQHLHPDERFLTLVATSLRWPNSLPQYFDTTTSQLNPHNTGNSFYVYGTWPVLLVKMIAELLNRGDYGQLTIVGRVLSALTDIGTMILVFLITKRLVKLSSLSSKLETPSSLLSMAIYALMALPIQLSHFFTTDPYVTFALTATLFSMTFSPSFGSGILTGLIFGLALAAKISAAPFLGIIILATGLHLVKSKKLDQIIIYVLSFGLISYCSLRIFMPYLFADGTFFTIHLNPKVLDNWKQLASFNDPKAWFPPAVQWIHTTPYIYPLLQIIFWGLGIPLTALIVMALSWSVTKLKQMPFLLIPLAFVLLTFMYQGYQFAKPMRYFYPMYPALAVITGIFVINQFRSLRTKNQLHSLFWSLVLGAWCFAILLWPISLMSIYSHPNTRVAASQWIYSNIPAGSTLTMEHWDDGLPLNFPGYLNSQYTTLELPMYAPDNAAKWNEINGKLAQVEYIILSSNRVYGSITSAPERYPETFQYYKDLFSGNLGFTPVAEFASRPTLPIPGIHICIDPPFFNYGRIDKAVESQLSTLNPEPLCPGLTFVDDYVDETWTVYDHPKVTIFRRNK